MLDYECFAFFCEDFRTEVGGKTSYMGILGSKIDIGPESEELPVDVTEVIPKLIAVALIKARKKGDIHLRIELKIENGPDETGRKMQSDHVLPVNIDNDENLIQFNVILPNVPVRPGMKITANYSIGEILFDATLLISRS